MSAGIVTFAKEYLAANAAESGADALIDNLVDTVEKLRAALITMRERDDRNGSLPKAYREIIDAALTTGEQPK